MEESFLGDSIPLAGRITILRFLPEERDQVGLSSDLVDQLQASKWELEVHELRLSPGLRSARIEQLLVELKSDVLVLVDASFGHHPDWFRTAIEQVAGGHSDIVVSGGTPRDFLGKSAARFVGQLTGCHAANASAIVARRSALKDRPAALRPAGRWFSLEMQLRIPNDRRVLSESHVPQRLNKAKGLRLGHPELSFLKSYIDLKYGNASRLIQFCAVGFSGMVVDLTLYAIFQALFRDTSLKNSKVPLIGGSVDLALSGFLAVWLAMSWNFLINRRFTFNDARRNASIVRQYLTYATGNALAIGVSLVIRLWLPTQVEFFNNHKLAAALVGIVLATGISFSMARYFVFKSPGKS
jgi:dolichol-phosphate mannosyltransferase